jgi:LysM repeat protein
MRMFGRNPARFLAPIALIAVVFALYSVVKDANAPKSGSDSGVQTSQPTATATKSSKKSAKKSKKKMYTVKSGDTPSGIADKYNISLATLEKLNPKLDPQSLSPGQRLKVSE